MRDRGDNRPGALDPRTPVEDARDLNTTEAGNYAIRPIRTVDETAEALGVCRHTIGKDEERMFRKLALGLGELQQDPGVRRLAFGDESEGAA